MRRRTLLALAAAAPAPVRAQSGAMRLVVPFAPGGSQDVLGRLLAQVAGPLVGQTIVIDNRAGGGGVVGAEAVARAAPDGNTLLLASAGQLTIAKAVGRNLPYDPIGSFTPILHLVDSPVALLAAPDVPANDAAALLRLARESRDPLPYGSTGIGTNTHLIMEDLAARTGLRVEHVPYRGAANAFNDLTAGRIRMMFVSVPSVLAASGTPLRVLGVTSRTRFHLLPDVPTLIESGVPGFEASIWTGLLGPAGMPPAVVERIAAAFRAALRTDPIPARLDTLGAAAVGDDGQAFGAMLRDDLARWVRVAAPLAIRLD